MNTLEPLRDGDRPVRTVETADGTAYVADLGPAERAAVDVVGDTVIAVIDGQQHELTPPGESPEAFIRNGILTITMEETA